MSFQEKIEEYKQKKEAKEFFNQNNSVYITALDLVKATIVGIIVATIGGYASLMVGELTGFNFSIVFVFIGVATSIAMKKTINNSGMKLAIAVVIVYILGMVCGTAIYWLNSAGLLFFDMGLIKLALQASFEYLTNDIFSIIMVAIGAYVGFNDAK